MGKYDKITEMIARLKGVEIQAEKLSWKDKKLVYFFGDGVADGSADDKNLLGGKGANLAEMTGLNIPVPSGFTITTDVCNMFLESNKYPKSLNNQISESIKKIESIMGKDFGSKTNPLLVSVRSGARTSMPGMMETVLNVGLTSETIKGLVGQTDDERFAYDSYRRLIMMYSDVVMEKAKDIKIEAGKEIRIQLEHLMGEKKEQNGIKKDVDLSAESLKELCCEFKTKIKDVLNEEFPDDPMTQLMGAINAVFMSWNGKRAINYRRIENIPDNWGTAVNIQSMVFGNMGGNSATGVAFTRNPATGENVFYGEWLENAQGEDVVAGIRTPYPLNEESKLHNSNLVGLDQKYPTLYSQLLEIRSVLESHYKDMQDIEFTIENKKLWMLQTRVGKRNGRAALKIALSFLNDGIITNNDVIARINSSHLNEIMLPRLDPKKLLNKKIIATGLPAGPGGATGQIVFSADKAEELSGAGKNVILVRIETSPEDVHGMHAAKGILTSRGGVTSHAALVARGWGRCCVVGCSSILIDYKNSSMIINNKKYVEGDKISLNGTVGAVYDGEIELIDANLENNDNFISLMKMCDQKRKLNIRTNSDTYEDSKIAHLMGAEGVGLCRTEHMFFQPSRIKAMREMILSSNVSERVLALNKLLPYQEQDFYNILKEMSSLPVTIRLLDPPLHEFLPNEEHQIQELAVSLGLTCEDIHKRIHELEELNPMLGHRGCRLGISYPEITSMQATAIFNASIKLIDEGYEPRPEIMIPLTGHLNEFINQKKIIQSTYTECVKNKNMDVSYLIGTMIELPRACIIAGEIAKEADFFSFGTNDLTQTTYGFSRDDINSFLPTYINKSIMKMDPFQSLDTEGVGYLIKLAIKRGRKSNPELKIGICGEHGGDPNSILFFNDNNLNYVSCSPYRVPIARLYAAKGEL